MKGIMQNLMLSCKKATELIEKKSVFGLSFIENIQLKSHTTMCSVCKKYETQSKIIEKALKNISEKTIPNAELSPDIKEKIISQLEKKIK